MSGAILEMRGVDKSFGSLNVLKSVNLNIYAGESMALMGENGAGKSTLMKILAGIEPYDKGTMIYKGKPYKPSNIHDAEKNGIVVIHQELNLFDEMTVLDNVFLGNEILNKGSIDYRAEREELQKLFIELKINIDPKQLVKELSIGQKQLVEIVKALRKKAQVLIMDEPTSALSEDEIAHVFEAIKTLKKQGVAIIYISHRMQEIYEICDRTTVLRDGFYVDEKKLSELTEDQLIELMVGREIDDPFPHLFVEAGEEYLRVENLQSQYLSNVNFTLKKGEILGIGGLMGSGRTTLAHTLFGMLPKKSGLIKVAGKEVVFHSPADALEHQIVYISEDRKGDGLFLDFSIMYNISIASLNLMSNQIGQIKQPKEKELSEYFKKITNVKANDINIIVQTLSGGNQQKVAIARALLSGSRVLILDEPTRGIDIGARREIYNLINEFKSKGTAIILISSDMPELLALSDRLIVMSEGKMTGELSFEEKSPENIIKLAVNI